MTSTSARFADYAAAPNRALTHVLEDSRYVARYVRDPDAQSPAGGVSSTARDLTQWMRLQLAEGRLGGEQVVAAAALAETHRPQIVSNQARDPAVDRAGFYGLGWNVGYDAHGRVTWSHSGAFSYGAATAVFLVPAAQLGIAVLTNAAPVGVPEALAKSFLDLALDGQIERDWLAAFGPLLAAAAEPAYGRAVDYARPPADRRPALPPEAYVGTYENAYFGPMDVVADEGELVLRLGPRATPYAMRRWDRDTYLYQRDGENAGPLSAIWFTIGPGQRAMSVTVENLDVHEQGTFSRARR